MKFINNYLNLAMRLLGLFLLGRAAYHVLGAEPVRAVIDLIMGLYILQSAALDSLREEFRRYKEEQKGDSNAP